MGIFDIFKRALKKEEQLEVLENPLERLKKGDIVELDGETWEVVGVAIYKHKGSVEKEWEIRSAKRSGFLSVEDDKIYFFEEIELDSIKPNLIAHYRRFREPLEEVSFGGKVYKLKSAGRAMYEKGFEKYPVEIWEFVSQDGEMIEAEIWDEYEIETYKGRQLKEWEIEGIFKRS
jgi:hypothetical protein